ncbi:MAG: hypothetical protein IMW89_11820 [Ktedonobacteraceae bacterium]|nr:hypothetical protein [Ktedonobacteraceae bacterium]
MMFTQSRDTHPEIERVQIELLRQATPERRLTLGLSLSEEAIEIARQAITRAHPLASEQERDLLFVEVTYGKELVDRVRHYLAGRPR